MRIRTRLFLGIAALMSALLLVQYALYTRQIDALNEELNALSLSVGKSMLAEALPALRTQVQVGAAASPSSAVSSPTVSSATNTTRKVVILRREVSSKGETHVETEELLGEDDPAHETFELDVVDDENGRRMTVRGLPGGERRITIPSEGATALVWQTSERSLLASSLLLAVSLGFAALFAHRMSRPLQALAEGAERIGRGNLEHRLVEDGPGELLELQRSFNRMATQLAQLETERQRWQSQAHLVELGELARGLAHTLRNPLHTLGLTVEELSGAAGQGADAGASRAELVTVARAQIQRIDRWLRSFLAVGAGNAATPEPIELNGFLEGLTLELLQQQHEIVLVLANEPVQVIGVPLALRAALSNLIDNAVAVSPPGHPPVLELTAQEDKAVITLTDWGPGIPETVRAHLFSPHITTRPGGSGMGLFLSRQILVTGHGGELELLSHAEGGTRAVVTLKREGGGA